MAPDPLRRDPRARAAVLAAAWALLAEEGWAGVSVDRIAARAGVGKQTVYRWWRGKGEVVFEAFLVRSRREAGEHVAVDLGELLRGYARTFVRRYAGTALGDRLRELLGAAQHDPELARVMRERWFEPRREPVRAAVARPGLAVDADVVLDLVFGPLHYRLLTGHGVLDRAYADAVAELATRAARG